MSKNQNRVASNKNRDSISILYSMAQRPKLALAIYEHFLLSIALEVGYLCDYVARRVTAK